MAVLDRAAYGGDGGAERMGIQTRFDYPDDYTLTPVVAVTLRVGSVQTASGASADADITDEESVGSVDEIPLRLTFTAGNDMIISDATVKAGEWTTIYVDVGSFDCAKNIDGIRISVGAENVGYAKLSVRDIVGYSRDSRMSRSKAWSRTRGLKDVRRRLPRVILPISGWLADCLSRSRRS